jgi:Asp-tRNA(Asn)/Glu-tRNA(Gln) amidotransferase A subunit family amidase
MDQTDDNRRLSRPFVTLARPIDNTAVSANPAQTSGSCVALADSIGSDQSKAATRLEQCKGAAEEVRGEVRVAVGLRMDQLKPIHETCSVALRHRVLAGERWIADDYIVNRYLAARGDRVPLKNLAEIVKSGRFHPNNQRRLEMAEKGPENGPDSPACQADTNYRQEVRAAVLKTMDKLKLDAFVYPTWSNPPRLIGDLNTPHGDNSQFYSPTTGFPAINVPMGFTRGGTLPAGMTIYGRAWSEAKLLKFAYAYEQETHCRRAPASTPPLR